MKKGLKILITLIVLTAVIIGGAMIALNQGLEEGKKVEIAGINLSNIDDGNYRGTYDFQRWSNELELVVKEHRITDIEIVKDVRFPNPELTIQLFEEVIEAQDTTVDIVSGSTVTSKAYLKAIEDALKK